MILEWVQTIGLGWALLIGFILSITLHGLLTVFLSKSIKSEDKWKISSFLIVAFVVGVMLGCYIISDTYSYINSQLEVKHLEFECKELGGFSFNDTSLEDVKEVGFDLYVTRLTQLKECQKKEK